MSPRGFVDQTAYFQDMADTLNDLPWLSTNEPMSLLPSFLIDTEPSDGTLEPSYPLSSPSERHGMEDQSSSCRKRRNIVGTPESSRRHSRIPRALPYPINGIDTPLDQRFFTHFVNVTSRVLTLRTDKTNPLLITVLPYSLHDPMVQKAILCLGASHIQRLQPNPERQVASGKQKLLHAAENAQVARIATHRREDAQVSSSELEAILCGTLLLCLYEISEGTGDLTWRVRLDAAKDLVENTINPREDTEGIQVDDFLLEFFVYHDILATVTDQSRTPILTPRAVACRRSEPTTAYMIGVDDGLFDLVARVAALRSNDSPTSTVCDALAIWEDLNSWESNTEDPDMKLGYSAYLGALFIWIYSILYPSNITDDKVRQVVKAGLEDMKAITDSGILAFLLFPTFVLGFASITEEERQVCSAQFHRLSKFSGLGNVKLAHDLVKSSWVEYDSGTDNTWDWVDHMARHGISIPVT